MDAGTHPSHDDNQAGSSSGGNARPAHQTDSPVTVQALEGRVGVRLEADERVLTVGQLLTLRPGLTHAVRALSESAFLLTLASEAPHPAEACG